MRCLSFKRKLLFILSIFFVITSFSIVVTASYSDIDSSPYVAEIEDLNNYGIIKGYPDGDFRPDIAITRMEFLALFSHVANIKEWDTTVSIYADIPQSHWGIGYANFCYDYGYMRLIDGSDTIKNVDLDENGSVTRIEELQFIPEIASAYRKELQVGQARDKVFPDNYISIDDALKLLINIMGYEASAEINGDYLKVAESIGLMDSVKYDENKYFTRENAAKLIHNALHIPIAETRMNEEGTVQETVILDGEDGKLYRTLLTAIKE